MNKLLRFDGIVRWILSYLTVHERWRCGLVCVPLRSVLKGGGVITHITDTIEINILTSILQHAKLNTLTQKFTNRKAPCTAICKAIQVTCFSSLRTLELRDMDFNDESVDILLKSECKQPLELVQLTLRNCSNAPIDFFLQNSPNIRRLDLRGNPVKLVVESLLKYRGKHLESLLLGWDSEFSSNDGVHLSESYSDGSDIQALFQHLSETSGPGITSFGIPGFVSVTYSAMAMLNTTNLTSVDLCCCRFITDNAIAPLLQNNGGLEHLNLRATSITDISLSRIASCCPELRSINVSCTPVSSRGIKALTSGCKKIKCLDLCYPSIVSTEALQEACITYGTNLEVLGIGGLPVTNSDLMFITQTCPNIRSLGIGSCSHLTSSIWTVLLGLSKLTLLIAHNLAVVDCAAITKLISKTKIKNLELTNSFPLTPEEAVYFTETYPFDWKADWESVWPFW